MKLANQLHQSIIDACKKNNAKAQMQLYDLYCNAMFQVALRYVNDRFIAEDLIQDAFIKAFKKINTYKEEVTFGAWLKRIVINQSIDYLKKKKLELVSMNDDFNMVEEDDYDWSINTSVSYQEVIKCIEQLKEKYRLVLTLFLLEGYDHREISHILGISEVNSRSYLLRGKKQVQEQLKSVRHV